MNIRFVSRQEVLNSMLDNVKHGHKLSKDDIQFIMDMVNAIT